MSLPYISATNIPDLDADYEDRTDLVSGAVQDLLASYSPAEGHKLCVGVLAGKVRPVYAKDKTLTSFSLETSESIY
jgi:hypothetical protein